MVTCFHRILFLILLECIASFAVAREAVDVPRSLRLLLQEIVYIRADYGNAVRAGSITDEDEYREMQDFAKLALEQFAQLKTSVAREGEALNIQKLLTQLSQAVNSRQQHAHIVTLTDQLNTALIEAFKLPVSPNESPSFSIAQRVYSSQCASCHGAQGQGDGPAGAHLLPKPRDFHDEDFLKYSSPFKFYNTLKTGVEGTAMMSYSGILNDQELWSVAFLLSGLRWNNENILSPNKAWEALPTHVRDELLAKGLSKSQLAGQDDGALTQWLHDLESKDLTGDELLRFLRTTAPYVDAIPLEPSLQEKEEQASTHTDKDQVSRAIQQTFSYIDKAKTAYANKNNYEAVQYLMEAYLLGFEKAEVTLSIVDRTIVSNIEKLFISARSYAREQKTHAFEETLEELEGTLNQALSLYNSQYTGKLGIEEHWRDFTSALVIILREGFEAFLIISALLALLNGMGEVAAKRWVHFGWLSAILMGFVSYYVFNMVINLSGAAKETVEAVSTGIAVVLLFYTGFWLLNQAEQKKWSSYVKEKTQTALNSGKLWGLFAISFIAVYREAAETVLFYSALYNNAKNSLSVTTGFFFGCIMLLTLCLGMIRFNRRLPIRQFFISTSVLMVTISIILTGKTVREMIEAGYFLSTPIKGFPAIDTLGIYPIVETLAAQASLLSLGLCIGYVLLRQKKDGLKNVA